MQNKAPWENRLFQLTRKGSDALNKFSEGESVNLDVYEIKILTMLKEQYLPFYEIDDDLDIGTQGAYSAVKHLEDEGYIINE